MSPYWKMRGGLNFHKQVLKMKALGVSEQYEIQTTPHHRHFTVTRTMVPAQPQVLHLMPFRLCWPGVCLHLYATGEEGDCHAWVGNRAVLDQGFRKQRMREVLPAETNHLLIKQSNCLFHALFNTAGKPLFFV